MVNSKEEPYDMRVSSTVLKNSFLGNQDTDFNNTKPHFKEKDKTIQFLQNAKNKFQWKKKKLTTNFSEIVSEKNHVYPYYSSFSIPSQSDTEKTTLAPLKKNPWLTRLCFFDTIKKEKSFLYRSNHFFSYWPFYKKSELFSVVPNQKKTSIVKKLHLYPLNKYQSKYRKFVNVKQILLNSKETETAYKFLNVAPPEYSSFIRDSIYSFSRPIHLFSQAKINRASAPYSSFSSRSFFKIDFRRRKSMNRPYKNQLKTSPVETKRSEQAGVLKTKTAIRIENLDKSRASIPTNYLREIYSQWMIINPFLNQYGQIEKNFYPPNSIQPNFQANCIKIQCKNSKIKPLSKIEKINSLNKFQFPLRYNRKLKNYETGSNLNSWSFRRRREDLQKFSLLQKKDQEFNKIYKGMWYFENDTCKSRLRLGQNRLKSIKNLFVPLTEKLSELHSSIIPYPIQGNKAISQLELNYLDKIKIPVFNNFHWNNSKISRVSYSKFLFPFASEQREVWKKHDKMDSKTKHEQAKKIFMSYQNLTSLLTNLSKKLHLHPFHKYDNVEKGIDFAFVTYKKKMTNPTLNMLQFPNKNIKTILKKNKLYRDISNNQKSFRPKEMKLHYLPNSDITQFSNFWSSQRTRQDYTAESNSSNSNFEVHKNKQIGVYSLAHNLSSENYSPRISEAKLFLRDNDSVSSSENDQIGIQDKKSTLNFSHAEDKTPQLRFFKNSFFQPENFYPFRFNDHYRFNFKNMNLESINKTSYLPKVSKKIETLEENKKRQKLHRENSLPLDNQYKKENSNEDYSAQFRSFQKKDSIFFSSFRKLPYYFLNSVFWHDKPLQSMSDRTDFLKSNYPTNFSLKNEYTKDSSFHIIPRNLHNISFMQLFESRFNKTISPRTSPDLLRNTKFFSRNNFVSCPTAQTTFGRWIYDEGDSSFLKRLRDVSKLEQPNTKYLDKSLMNQMKTELINFRDNDQNQLKTMFSSSKYLSKNFVKKKEYIHGNPLDTHKWDQTGVSSSHIQRTPVFLTREKENTLVSPKENNSQVKSSLHFSYRPDFLSEGLFKKETEGRESKSFLSIPFESQFNENSSKFENYNVSAPLFISPLNSFNQKLQTSKKKQLKKETSAPSKNLSNPQPKQTYFLLKKGNTFNKKIHNLFVNYNLCVPQSTLSYPLTSPAFDLLFDPLITKEAIFESVVPSEKENDKKQNDPVSNLDSSDSYSWSSQRRSEDQLLKKKNSKTSYKISIKSKTLKPVSSNFNSNMPFKNWYNKTENNLISLFQHLTFSLSNDMFYFNHANFHFAQQDTNKNSSFSKFLTSNCNLNEIMNNENNLKLPNKYKLFINNQLNNKKNPHLRSFQKSRFFQRKNQEKERSYDKPNALSIFPYQKNSFSNLPIKFDTTLAPKKELFNTTSRSNAKKMISLYKPNTTGVNNSQPVCLSSIPSEKRNWKKPKIFFMHFRSPFNTLSNNSFLGRYQRDFEFHLNFDNTYSEIPNYKVVSSALRQPGVNNEINHTNVLDDKLQNTKTSSNLLSGSFSKKSPEQIKDLKKPSKLNELSDKNSKSSLLQYLFLKKINQKDLELMMSDTKNVLLQDKFFSDNVVNHWNNITSMNNDMTAKTKFINGKKETKTPILFRVNKLGDLPKISVYCQKPMVNKRTINGPPLKKQKESISFTNYLKNIISINHEYFAFNNTDSLFFKWMQPMIFWTLFSKTLFIYFCLNYLKQFFLVLGKEYILNLSKIFVTLKFLDGNLLSIIQIYKEFNYELNKQDPIDDRVNKQLKTLKRTLALPQ